MQLSAEQSAPMFALPDQDGQICRLTDYRGKWVILYFYPKDDTPGCTTEACNFRDSLPRFDGVGAEILGVSGDSIESHKSFAQKYKLPFRLLSDEGRQVATSYGVWVEKSFMGKKYMGVERSTFLISPEGKIAKIYHKVKPDVHAADLVNDLAELRSQAG